MTSERSSVEDTPNLLNYDIAKNITLHRPLSQRGTGPGVILLVDSHLDLSQSKKTLDPPPLLKWAEEGYCVVQIRIDEQSSGLAGKLQLAVAELRNTATCHPSDKVGLIIMQSQIDSALAAAVSSCPDIVAVVFHGSPTTSLPVPLLAHVSHDAELGNSAAGEDTIVHKYPSIAKFFNIPGHIDYKPGPASLAHSRTLGFLKSVLGGPNFDLAALWEEHTRHEFAERSVAATMSTMVAEPYVNHVPTMTGGVGRTALTAFYAEHFIFNNAEDAALELVSRTVGVDRVVDEFLFCCTHDRVIDWLLPGVPPTGKKLSIPFTAIVNFRGDRLYHEHIAWDQGTVLRQLGLLPEYLPFPYSLPDGACPASGRRVEYRVPVAGVECAQKLVDENVIESNSMFEYAIREVDDK